MLLFLYQFRAREFTTRDPASYDYHCYLLQGPLGSEMSTTYGISFESPLNSIPYFHVANSQLPQDVMHVLLEGVVPKEMRLMLNVFVNIKKLFSLYTLNERIRCFPYSPEEAKDKPCPINPNVLSCADGSFHQSGKAVS